MKNFREVLNELAVVASSASTKKTLNENARQETVQYITRMKEAFGDMENPPEETSSTENLPSETPTEEQPEEKTLEERVADLEKEVADLKAKLENKE